MDVDGMIGADFGRGLASLKSLAESAGAGNAEAARPALNRPAGSP
jgi:hypothetical protein